MRRMRILLISAIGVIVSASFTAPVVARDTKRAASGETQIVARLDGREITISDLRSEQARLGLSPNDPNAERIALESIVNRALLTTDHDIAGLDVPVNDPSFVHELQCLENLEANGHGERQRKSLSGLLTPEVQEIPRAPLENEEGSYRVLPQLQQFTTCGPPFRRVRNSASLLRFP